MVRNEVICMGIFKKLGFKKNSSQERPQDHINDNRFIGDQENEYSDRLFTVRMSNQLMLKRVYLFGDEWDSEYIDYTPNSNLVMNQNGIFMDSYYNYRKLVGFNYGEYIKFNYSVAPNGFKWSMYFWVSAGCEENSMMFGINEDQKISIDEYYEKYNMELHNKILNFSSTVDGLENLAKNAIMLCDKNILLDIQGIKFLYYMYSCYYKPDDIEDISDKYQFYMENKTVRTVDTLISNISDILAENTDETQISLAYVAFEAFMREYINYFAAEYDKKLLNDFGRTDIIADVTDYKEYISKAVKNFDDLDEDEFILEMTCKLIAIGLFEYKDSLISLFEIVRQITLAEIINKKDNEIKDLLRGKASVNTKKYCIDDTDLMDGYTFEDFLSKLFNNMGYITNTTSKSGDQGIDIIAKKNGRTVGIQAKCYSNKVGNSAIQEAVAGKNIYNCDTVMVITNNYFTKSAVELARANEVILWDRDTLSKKIDNYF